MNLPYLPPQACLALIAGLLAFAPLAEADVLAPVLAPSTADSTVGIDVEITCATPGAFIRYTLNGTDPTLHDRPIVSGESIRVSRNAVVKARAWLDDEPSPVVTEDYRITGAVSCGYQHGLALSVAGRVWSWGEQASGRLGNGSTAAADITTPGRVLLPPDNFELGSIIAAGYDHSLVVDQSRQTWAFGENGSGQLGNNATTDSALPVRVLKSATAGDFLGAVTGADAGQNFSLALLENGTPVTWGSQSSGRLGNGVNSSSSRKYAGPVENGSDPAYPDLTGIRQISAGHGHGLAREANASEVEAATGRVWVWGSNGSGQLGRGDTSTVTRAYPMLVAAGTELTHALDVSGGGAHTAVVRWEANNPDLDGTVWSCGNQSGGRLGNGVTSSGSVTYPVKAIKVGGDPLTGIRQVSAGPSHTLALDADGHVWAWGDNSYGQLGDGTTTDNGHARLVLGANGTGTLENIVMVTAGGESTNGRSMALAGDGTIWVWGRNNEGQLGNGQTAGATILPVAHAQNHVAEGEPKLTITDHDVTVPLEHGSVSIETLQEHSGPLGVAAIDRVEIYFNGELVQTLEEGVCNCEPTGLDAGIYRAYGIIYDVNEVMAMSNPVTFVIWEPGTDDDGDGLANEVELALGTDPGYHDSDWDGMEDGWEHYYGLPLLDGNPSNGSNTGPAQDLDGDDRSNHDEFLAGLIPDSAIEQPYANSTPPGIRWFGTAGTAYTVESSDDGEFWFPTGFTAAGLNNEITVAIPLGLPILPAGDYFRIRSITAVTSDDWDGDGISNADELTLHFTDPLTKDVISVFIDGTEYFPGQTALNIPYRQGESTVPVRINLPAALQGNGSWSSSPADAGIWTPRIAADDLIDLPTGSPLDLRYEHAGKLLLEVGITWTLIAPDPQQSAITGFTIKNNGYDIAAAKAPLGYPEFGNGGGTGMLELKKSGATGTYFVDLSIALEPGFNPQDYSYRVFSGFRLPQEFPNGGSTGGSQVAPQPFSLIPDGTETLPLQIIQNPFPASGNGTANVTVELIPTYHGDGPFTFQIIPTPVGGGGGDTSQVFAEATADGYSSCSSCSSCITPQVSLQDTPVTLSLGSADGYEPTGSDPENPQDPEDPEDRFEACEADGELTFNIPSLYDPSVSAITNPGMEGIGILAPRGAYEVTTAGQVTEITGERHFVIEPWANRADTHAVKVTGNIINGETLTKYVTMTVELVDINGVPTLEVKHFQGENTDLKIHHFFKETQGDTVSAVLRSHNDTRELRREFTPAAGENPVRWTERRIAKELPSSGEGDLVAVHDEELRIRKFSSGVSRVEQQTVDPDNRALKTHSSYYESSQDSGGSLGTSMIGAGKLKKKVSHDGYEMTVEYSEGEQKTKTPYAGNPQGTVLHVQASKDGFAAVDTALGTAGSQASAGEKIKILGSTTVEGESGGPSANKPEAQQWGGSAVVTGQGTKATVRNYLPRTDTTAPGRIARIKERSGRLTTWSYRFNEDDPIHDDEWTEEMERGEPDTSGTAVEKGERVTTTRVNCMSVISEVTEGFNHAGEKGNPVFLTARYSAPNDFDALGRTLRVHYDMPESEDLESFTYSCCGVYTHTGRRGKIIEYSYDSLGRIDATTVKRASDGIATVFATSREGLSVTNLRNDVEMSRTIRNLAGELVSSASADEDGDFDLEESAYIYSYSAAGTRTLETGPLGTVTVTDAYPDGKTKAVWGNAVADRAYVYETPGILNRTEIITEYLLKDPYDGNLAGELEQMATAYDDEGRQVARLQGEWQVPLAEIEYDATTGLRFSSTDGDGVTTSYTYHKDGSPLRTIREISNGRVAVGIRRYGYAKDDLFGGNARGSRVQWNSLRTDLQDPDGYEDSVSTTYSRGDGYASRTWSASSGTSLSYSTLPNSGDRADGAWTSTSIAPDQSRTVSEYEDGLLANSSFKDSANATVSWTAYAYDGIGRLLSSEDSRTGVTTHVSGGALQMTASGNLLYGRDPGGRVTTFAYDALGRRVTTTLPDDTSTFTSYDAMGNVAATWGSQTYPQRYGYDQQGRMKTLDTWRNNPPAGDPVLATGDDHDRTTWHYDVAGRLGSKEDALGRATEYEYSPAGRLATRTWARSFSADPEDRIVTTYVRDEGLLEQVTYNDGTTPGVTYAHDGYGRVETVTQVGNSWSYAYDPQKWLLSRETISYDLDNNGTPELQRILNRNLDAIGRSTGFQFGGDTNGSPATLESIDAGASYYYDVAGRLDRISGGGLLPGPLGADFGYQFVGDSASLIQGVVSSYYTEQDGWDPTRDTLVSKTYRDTFDLSLTATVGYGLDSLGRRISRTEDVNVVGETVRHFGYNERGELVFDGSYPTAFIGTTPLPTSEHDRGYAYDGIGNRKLTSSGNPLPDEAAPAQLGEYFAASGGASGAADLNQYGQVKLPGIAPVAVIHDLDGNMTSGPLPEAPGESSTLEWDAENRLVATETGASGPVVQYAYDPFGRRIAKSVSGGASELYAYDGWNLIVRYSGSGTALTSYFWGLDLSGSLQGAGGVGGLLAIQERSGNGSAKAGKTICPQYDGNGNIIRLVESVYNSTSQTWETLTIASYAYDGFGNRLNPAASDIDGSGYAEQQEFGFSTKFRDADTELLYYGYRYYDPVLGRWPSRDPIEEEGGANLYALLNNSATSKFDVLGLIEWPKDKNDCVNKCRDILMNTEHGKRLIAEVEALEAKNGEKYTVRGKQEGDEHDNGHNSSTLVIYINCKSSEYWSSDYKCNDSKGFGAWIEATCDEILNHELVHARDRLLARNNEEFRRRFKNDINDAKYPNQTEKNAVENTNKLRREKGKPPRTIYNKKKNPGDKTKSGIEGN